MTEIFKQTEKLRKLLPPQNVQINVEYYPSQFALSFTHKGKSYVFHTLTKQCLETELPASCHAGAGYDDLVAGYFMVPRDKDEDAFYVSILSLINTYYANDGNDYMILPTLGCNARCIYCFEKEMVPVSMTDETAEQTAKYIIDTHKAGKPVHLWWFGGEPLLGEKHIDLICRKLGDAGIEYYSSMTTNGSLITPEIVEKMKKLWNLRGVSISMEGPEEDYRRRKNYIKYHDEYHKVMEAVNMLVSAGMRVTVRCNVDKDNIDDIPAFIEDMRLGVRNKEGICLYLAVLNDERMGDNDLQVWGKVLSMDPLIEAAGFRTSSHQKSGVRFRSDHCLSDQGYSVISPEGKLFACENCLPESLYGDVWNGSTEEAARKEFIRMDRVREKCCGCAFLPLCTPFSHCPEEDTHCREVTQLFLLDTLRHNLDRKEKDEKTKTKTKDVSQGEEK
ncbi:MAG: radical SAM protein [Clostridia bacterium]|nr:radical SAM protein [Clostridia bacterium]